MKTNRARWDLFLYHAVLYIGVHFLFAIIIGVQPLSQLESGSYVDHILDNFWNHGVNIYADHRVNIASGVWKTVLFVHLIVELIETLFPSKKKPEAEQTALVQEEKAVIKQPVQETKKENTGSAWGYLIVAGLLEIIWATALKMDMLGGPLIITLIISFDLLIKAVKRIGVGAAYAVFTGMGTAGLVIVDVVFFRETLSMLKVFFILLLVIFIIGLKWTSDTKGDVGA